MAMVRRAKLDDRALENRAGLLRSKAMIDSSPPADKVADAVVLRPLAISEAFVAAEVVRIAFAAQPRPTCPPSSALNESAASIAAKIDAGGGVGAWAEGRLAGLAVWQVVGDALHAGRVSVLPERRGEGLSRRLLGACEDAARRLGLERVTRRVRLELPENERLFERFGFIRWGIEAHDGFDAPTVALMEKRLS